MLKIKRTTPITMTNTTPEVIPMEVAFNSNPSNIRYDTATNTTNILRAGKYMIDINVEVTATATGARTIALYYNGTIIPETARAYTFATVGSTKSYAINDAEKIIPSFSPADISQFKIMIDGGATIDVAEARFIEVK